MTTEIDFRHVNDLMYDKAIKSVEDADPLDFLYTAINNQHYLGLVWDNLQLLKDKGMYEAALLGAFTGCRINNRHFTEQRLQFMFDIADREMLRSAGDPLPHAGPFVIYRGISGIGRARRPRGFSWTISLPVACSFAQRMCNPNPAVITATVSPAEVLAYKTSRSEDEVIVRPNSYKVLIRDIDEMKRIARQQVFTSIESEE